MIDLELAKTGQLPVEVQAVAQRLIQAADGSGQSMRETIAKTAEAYAETYAAFLREQ